MNMCGLLCVWCTCNCVHAHVCVCMCVYGVCMFMYMCVRCVYVCVYVCVCVGCCIEWGSFSTFGLVPRNICLFSFTPPVLAVQCRESLFSDLTHSEMEDIQRYLEGQTELQIISHSLAKVKVRSLLSDQGQGKVISHSLVRSR